MTRDKSEPGFWQRMREKRWFRWSVDILFFVAIISIVMLVQTWDHVADGERAPLFVLSTLEGEQMSSEDLLGKPSVLFFWAPWCGVCKADAHNIEDVREAVGDQANIVSVALSYEDLESVRGFVREHGVTGPVLLGNRGTSREFRIDSFPTIYILDERGRVASSVVGYTTEFGIRMRLARLGVF